MERTTNTHKEGVTDMPWITLVDEDDCPPGAAREFVAEGRVVAIFNVQGDIYALDGICPHQGGPLGQGTLEGCIVTCPWHGWQFDVRDGQNQLSPRVCHTVLPTKREQGKILVELP